MKETYLDSIKEINEKINELDPKTQSDERKQWINRKHELTDEYIESCKPCNYGDLFTCVSHGGRKIKGIAVSFRVFNGDVMVDSYNPVINGKKKSTVAYFSLMYNNFEVQKP